ncbi:MAG: methionyl-tRNA formyltransferase [Verrucomicrobiota bacterium]|jgi:methionyl-tRNA formyltransferase
MADLRIIFMGTAQLSCASLESLIDAPGFRVLAAVTQPDRRRGRQMKLHPSPVKELAARRGLPVLQPERAREEAFVAELRRLGPDLIAVTAFGQLLPQRLLDLPRYGCLNVHTSLLPRYRGAAPIQWAILEAQAQTGVTIMKMDAGLDTGPILAQEATPIGPEDDSQTLHDRLGVMGARLLVRTIRDYVAGSLTPNAQPETGSSWAPKIKKQDGRIAWTEPAPAIRNRVRALIPWPGAFTFLAAQPQPLLLKVWRAEVLEASGPPGQVLQADKTGIVIACGRQALRVLSLQREGGRRLSAQEFLAGHALHPGQSVQDLGPHR